MYHRATVAGTVAASMRSPVDEIFDDIPCNLCTQDRQQGRITADRHALSTRLHYF
jgi:hypothetical protein